MATAVILPKQGQSVETCIITEWYKKKGERVEKGELLFAYETDKSSFEEEAKLDGILLEVYYEAGDEIPVLSEVAVIGEPGEQVEGKAQPADTAETPEMTDGEIELSPEAEETAAVAGTIVDDLPGKELQSDGQGTETREKIRISPRARKMAELKGIPVENIPGTGPNGRIIVRDIETAASAIPAGAPEETVVAAPEVPASPAKQPAEEGLSKVPGTPAMEGDWEDRPLTNIRRLISQAMHNSLQNSAQLTHHLSADARSILSLRNKVKKMQEEGYPNNITLNDMICFAVVRALKKHQSVNVHFLGESIRYFKKIHLGIAVDTERGLMVPALRNADDMSLVGLSNQINHLAASCRSGKIDPDLLQPEAATFTVSNLGNYGVEMFTPVINLPQAAILGVNTILERPARMEDGTFGFVPYLGLSLTYDHRALDGGPATIFLAEIKTEIEQFNHELINL